jgi:hypothetical protein
MGSHSRSNTNQQTQGIVRNDYGWMTAPETADTATLRSMVAPITPDPSIPYAFAAQRQRLGNSFNNPLGAYTSPAVRDAVGRSAGKALGMEERVASELSRRAAQETAFGQQAHIAQMTDPRLVQTGGSSTGSMVGNTTQSYNPGIGSYIGAAAGVGASLI